MPTDHFVSVSKPADCALQVELICASQITKKEAIQLLKDSRKLPNPNEFVEYIPLHCANWGWVGSYWSIAYDKVG